MSRGFTLLEVLASLSITMVIGAAVFHLYQQNERVFHDQYLVQEMQQGARAAASLTAEEIRMAGQGVPLYAVTYDAAPSEYAVAILSGSSSTRINFQAGIAPTESAVTTPGPLTITAGIPILLTANDVTGLYNAIGGSPAGRFLYIWGLSAPGVGSPRWSWIRALIHSVTPSSNSVLMTATEAGASGSEEFAAAPTMSLEEATAIYHDSSTGTMRRTTATNLTDPLNPSWAPANELATNVTLLHFDYFDKSGNPVIPDTLANRARVARVDIRLQVQTTQDLSNHTRPTYTLSVTTSIRNMKRI